MSENEMICQSGKGNKWKLSQPSDAASNSHAGVHELARLYLLQVVLLVRGQAEIEFDAKSDDSVKYLAGVSPVRS